MNDPDRAHDGAPGFRHTFDATDAVTLLEGPGSLDPASLRVMFEPMRVVPPVGLENLADEEMSEPVTPVRIGRVSIFVV